MHEVKRNPILDDEKPNIAYVIKDEKVDSSLPTTESQKNQKLTTTCSLCGKVFGTHRKMRCHISAYHDRTIVQCDICQKHGIGRKAMRDHMNAHKSVTCNKCGELVKANSYPEHKQKCQKILPSIRCPHDNCDFRANYTSRIRRHIKRSKHIKNIGEKHRCSFCNDTFVKKIDLRDHRRRNHALFKCKDCNKRFRKRYSLESHQSKAHTMIKVKPIFKLGKVNSEEKEGVITKDQMFYCVKCTFESKYKSSVKRHYKTHGHGDDSKVISVPSTICELCGHKFRKPSKLKYHKPVCKLNIHREGNLIVFF